MRLFKFKAQFDARTGEWHVNRLRRNFNGDGRKWFVWDSPYAVTRGPKSARRIVRLLNRA